MDDPGESVDRPDSSDPAGPAGPAGPAAPAAPLVFTPARGWVTAFAGVAALAAIAAVFADAEGRVLAIAVAIAFVSLLVNEVRTSPRLLAGADGITTRTLGGARHLPWSQVESIRVDRRSRFGRTVRTLEIDAGETLIVLGARALGADPETAARRIVAAAPPAYRVSLGAPR